MKPNHVAADLKNWIDGCVFSNFCGREVAPSKEFSTSSISNEEHEDDPKMISDIQTMPAKCLFAI
ncbi:hypothetical protein NECAME_13757 [Necator americanus]|uniref:Uncharacterized protein n=1 Tax=Necator americanus TaxID=51031 RepID=W2SVJ6_NECAM|nr:hypothetical protein NECAME_13757 [Necator americanus]ETN72737.1 hypothetical protein NECAME_13757 [Necator americanus]